MFLPPSEGANHGPWGVRRSGLRSTGPDGTARVPTSLAKTTAEIQGAVTGEGCCPSRPQLQGPAGGAIEAGSAVTGHHRWGRGGGAWCVPKQGSRGGASESTEWSCGVKKLLVSRLRAELASRKWKTQMEVWGNISGARGGVSSTPL